MIDSLERVRLLIHEEGIAKFSKTTVMIVGVGGVGSFCAEALARSGIGTLILVDGDSIAPSNLNRQIHATYKTIHETKVEVMKKRIESYSNCEVITYSIFYNKEQNAILFQQPIDFVVDAIDTMTSKVDLIESCLERNIHFISSMGMANRFDPTQIKVTELMKTTYDPVARIMRGMVRKRNIKAKIPVVCSIEQPFIQHQIIDDSQSIRKAKMPPASMICVPATAGLACASYVMDKILEEVK